MTKQSRWCWICAFAAALLLVAGGSLAWHLRGRPRVRAIRLLGQARKVQSAGDFRRGEVLSRAALDIDPAFGEAALLAAECAAESGQFQRAIEHLRLITPAEPGVRFRALLLTAQLDHHRLRRLGDAERAYRAALELAPDDVAANDGLARLLGLCGRAREAIPYALTIVRQERPTDLLVLMAHSDGVLNDPGALEAAIAADPADANPLVGSAWHAAAAEQTDRSIGLLREALARAPR